MATKINKKADGFAPYWINRKEGLVIFQVQVDVGTLKEKLSEPTKVKIDRKKK